MTGRVNVRHRVLDDGRVCPVVDRDMVDRAQHAITAFFVEHGGSHITAPPDIDRDLAKAALRGALGPDLIIDREGERA